MTDYDEQIGEKCAPRKRCDVNGTAKTPSIDALLALTKEPRLTIKLRFVANYVKLAARRFAMSTLLQASLNSEDEVETVTVLCPARRGQVACSQLASG